MAALRANLVSSDIAPPFSADTAATVTAHLRPSLGESEDDNTDYALHASERELRLIVQNIAGLICVFSPLGELIGGNQQLLDYFRLPLDEVGRWATNGTIHPEDLHHCLGSFSASLSSGEPYDFETRLMRFDGAFRWFQFVDIRFATPTERSCAGTVC